MVIIKMYYRGKNNEIISVGNNEGTSVETKPQSTNYCPSMPVMLLIVALVGGATWMYINNKKKNEQRM